MSNVISRVQEHYDESLNYFTSNEIVGCFLQGSQNYGLAYEGSDVDTKLIVVPTFKDIALNRKPVSTTYVRANVEHTDWKDVRLYMETFRKQNLNFLEILFTDYKVMNPYYENQWNRLVGRREEIARMNPWRAVKSMKGIAMEKYHAMKHPYPSKLDILAEHGYDGKQVSHLIRVADYLARYINGESYESCLYPSPHLYDEIMAYKLHKIPLEIAEKRADEVIDYVSAIADNFCVKTFDNESVEMRELLEDVQYEIMRQAVVLEVLTYE